MKHVSLYITFGSKAEAERIGRALLEERLVACVNIFDPVQSMYWWEGRLESAAEVAMIAKTVSVRVDDCIGRIRALHSYACPCIVQWPIEKGCPDFLKWMERETRC